VHRRAAGLDFLGPGDGLHQQPRFVLGDVNVAALRSTRKALLGTPEPLHDLGHILGATRFAQARLQLGQHGLEAGRLGVIYGAVFLLARRRMAVQERVPLRVQHALDLDLHAACGRHLGGLGRVELALAQP